jgi:hypothetical protein
MSHDFDVVTGESAPDEVTPQPATERTEAPAGALLEAPAAAPQRACHG